MTDDYTVPTFADTEERVDASTLRVGDFIVRTWPVRFRGPRGGAYLVRPVMVQSGVTSLGYDDRGNLLARTLAHKGGSLILYPGQEVTVRRCTSSER